MNKSLLKKRLIIALSDPFCLAFIKGQAKYMKERGFEVYLFCPKGYDIEKFAIQEECVFVEIPYKREMSVLSDMKCLYMTYRKIREINPDIINAGTPKAGLLCMLAGKIAGTKIRIFTLRGLRSITLKGHRKNIIRISEKISCLCASRIIAISPSLKEEAIRLHLSSPHKFSVLLKGSSNGVDLKRFYANNELITKAEMKKKELNISPCSFIFGYVGRIVKDKGIEEVVLAFEKLQELYDIKLILVGPYEANNPVSHFIVEKIKNNDDIIDVGYSDDIPLYSLLMDIIILASYREGFGNIVIEAAAMGTPAIVSNVPGARDSIVHNETGLLIEPKNIDSLFASMKYYIENQEIVKIHGLNGKKRVEEFFVNELIWKEQEKIYNTLINSTV